MVDTTYSDLILMIGGQVLTLFLLLLVTLFGTDPIASRLSMPIPSPLPSASSPSSASSNSSNSSNASTSSNASNKNNKK